MPLQYYIDEMKQNVHQAMIGCDGCARLRASLFEFMGRLKSFKSRLESLTKQTLRKASKAASQINRP